MTTHRTRLMSARKVHSRSCRLALTALVLGAASPGGHATASISASIDFRAQDGAFEPGRFLNVAESGGIDPQDPDYFPRAFAKLRDAGVRRIRMDHLTSTWNEVTTRDEHGVLHFDFTLMDRVIVPLLAHGMEPFMCLSYTPDALGRGMNQPPDDFADWQALVGAYVAHYRDMGHTGWYWEVWNEPDVEDFWAGTVDQYLELYRVTAATVKAADPTAKVGGPAAAIWWEESRFMLPRFFAFLRDHPKVPCDFVSWHPYWEDGFDSVEVINALFATYGIAPREIIASEWGHDVDLAAGAGSAKDTNELAAYLAQRLDSLVRHPEIAQSYYFCATDLLWHRATFIGDPGLITFDGHAKAGLNFMAMVRRLEGTRLAADIRANGEPVASRDRGVLATVKPDTGRLALLLWNNTAETTTVDLRIHDLPARRFDGGVRVARSLIDATHGNAYADYAAGYRGIAPGPSENLAEVTSHEATSEGEWATTEILAPHSVEQILLDPLLPEPEPDSDAMLLNLSARAFVGTDDEILIGGLAIAGAPLRVLVRAVGPTLADLDVSRTLEDPVLHVYTAGRPVASNDDWSDQADAGGVREAARQCGAFPLADGSRDAALVLVLDAGTHTFHVAGGDGGTGVALLEIYRFDEASSAGRLVNLSGRARVAQGEDILITGLVTGGSSPACVVVRGVGPGLAPLGIADFLPDPRLVVHRRSAQVASADNWSIDYPADALRALYTRLGAFGFSQGSADAALSMIIEPGIYTVHVADSGQADGVALAEFYLIVPDARHDPR